MTWVASGAECAESCGAFIWANMYCPYLDICPYMGIYDTAIICSFVHKSFYLCRLHIKRI